MSLYETYKNFVASLHDFSNFKSNPDYNYMLEHVDFNTGMSILNVLINELKIDEKIISRIVKKNDEVGNPIKYKYTDDIVCSPTSIRYIYHAHIILDYMKKLKLNNINIVEIGGGYGGLCLCIYNMKELYNVEIKSYTIIDLNEVHKLQREYLKYHNIDAIIKDADKYGSDIDEKNNFLIATYSFSEFEHDIQKKYAKNLFSKLNHGFFVWNRPLYDIGLNCKIEDEYPNYGCDNKFIFF